MNISLRVQAINALSKAHGITYKKAELMLLRMDKDIKDSRRVGLNE